MAKVDVTKTYMETTVGITLTDTIQYLTLSSKDGTNCELFPNLGSDHYVIDCKDLINSRCGHLEVQFIPSAVTTPDSLVVILGDITNPATAELHNPIILPFDLNTGGGSFTLESHFLGSRDHITICLLSQIIGGTSGTITDCNIFLGKG